ncbi:MAG: Mut7-C RNAse domain-containing protein [Promethearchaeota archaeon]|jgi:uncharacterized protein with PIN domain
MKFLVDSMLGKLSRFLRIFGYDTIYANDLIEIYMINPVPDEKLIKFAEENDRFIITKDLLLHKMYSERSLYLDGEGIYNYLHQLKEKLNLNFEFKLEKAKCTICNSKLRKIQDKNEILNLVLQDSFDNYEEFYRCSNLQCNKIFWKGSHIEDIEKRLEKEFITN